MNPKKILLALVAAATLFSVPPAMAARAVVAVPLKEAAAAANAGDFETAAAKVKEAASAPNKTSQEVIIISGTRKYVAAKMAFAPPRED